MTADAKILTALRQTASGISGAELAQQLGITRPALSRHIEDLRALGYDISASPHLGYRLISSPDVLHADDLYSRLGPAKIIGREIHVFNETTSTNDVASRLARGGAAEGVVVFAESQTKGRGRLGRQWISPPGKGLWFTVLLRPKISPQAATQLTLAAATALTRAIAQQTGITPEIKWPNDLLIHGRKIVGILSEMTAEMDNLNEVLLGIGMDVNLQAEDLPADLRKIATSLRIEAGQPINRAELAAAAMRELDKDYELVKQGNFQAIAEQWEEHCTTLDREVTIRVGEHITRGRAESLDEDGALLIRGASGHLERIVGGDVSVI